MRCACVCVCCCRVHQYRDDCTRLSGVKQGADEAPLRHDSILSAIMLPDDPGLNQRLDDLRGVYGGGGGEFTGDVAALAVRSDGPTLNMRERSRTGDDSIAWLKWFDTDKTDRQLLFSSSDDDGGDDDSGSSGVEVVDVVTPPKKRVKVSHGDDDDAGNGTDDDDDVVIVVEAPKRGVVQGGVVADTDVVGHGGGGASDDKPASGAQRPVTTPDTLVDDARPGPAAVCVPTALHAVPLRRPRLIHTILTRKERHVERLNEVSGSWM